MSTIDVIILFYLLLVLSVRSLSSCFMIATTQHTQSVQHVFITHARFCFFLFQFISRSVFSFLIAHTQHTVCANSRRLVDSLTHDDFCRRQPAVVYSSRQKKKSKTKKNNITITMSLTEHTKGTTLTPF